jgi:hypothetical protein
MSEQSGITSVRQSSSLDQTVTASHSLATDREERHRDCSCSQDTVDKDVHTSDSLEEDSDMEECYDDLSEHDFDGDARFSSKSLISLSSKASSSTKPVSTKSVSSHQSTCTSSSISGDENDGPTVGDIKVLQQQLQQSLEEEEKLLGIQQKLLTQMEEVEHSIIRTEHEERIARVTAQQVRIIDLLDRTRNTEELAGVSRY